MIFRRILIILILAGLAYGYFLGLPSHLENRALQSLHALGYKRASIESVTVTPFAFVLENVALDSNDINTIKTIYAELNWFDFLTAQKIHSLSFSNLSLSIIPSSKDLNKLGAAFRALTAQTENIQILAFESAQIDIATNIGDLRLESTALIEQHNGQSHKIAASVWADQYQLSFASNLSGRLENDLLSLDAHIKDGRVHAGPIHISRANGWLNIQGKTDSAIESTGDFQAGGGTLFDIPLQNIAILVEGQLDKPHIVFKTQAAGVPSINLNMDYKPEHFAATLDIPSSEDLRNLLSGLQAEQKETIATLFTNFDGFTVNAQYLPERRFAEGPLPFTGTVLSKDDKTLMDGHFLIYPENLDMRGSADIDPILAKDLGTLSPPLQSRINGDLIRLDGNLKKILEAPGPTQ